MLAFITKPRVLSRWDQLGHQSASWGLKCLLSCLWPSYWYRSTRNSQHVKQRAVGLNHTSIHDKLGARTHWSKECPQSVDDSWGFPVPHYLDLAGVRGDLLVSPNNYSSTTSIWMDQMENRYLFLASSSSATETWFYLLVYLSMVENQRAPSSSLKFLQYWEEGMPPSWFCGSPETFIRNATSNSSVKLLFCKVY